MQGQRSAFWRDQGFEARRLARLSPRMIRDLTERMFRRLSADVQETARVSAELMRKQNATLACIPITLCLLVHVLLQNRSGLGARPGSILSKVQIYSRAVQL